MAPKSRDALIFYSLPTKLNRNLFQVSPPDRHLGVRREGAEVEEEEAGEVAEEEEGKAEEEVEMESKNEAKKEANDDFKLEPKDNSDKTLRSDIYLRSMLNDGGETKCADGFEKGGNKKVGREMEARNKPNWTNDRKRDRIGVGNLEMIKDGAVKSWGKRRGGGGGSGGKRRFLLEILLAFFSILLFAPSQIDAKPTQTCKLRELKECLAR